MTTCSCADPAPLDVHAANHQPGKAWRCGLCGDEATEGPYCVKHERGRRWWK